MANRILSWGLILSLLLTLLPFTATAADGNLSQNRYTATETAQCICGAQPDAEGVTVHEKTCPQADQQEISAFDTAAADGTDTSDRSTYTVEDDTSPLIPNAPIIYCAPLDEASSSDMVLTVEGEWDSYVWESCVYGSWSYWEGDGPSLILSKEDFVYRGFRCTVTRGEQSVTSEVFAYDTSVLETPKMSLMSTNSLSKNSTEDSSAYIKYNQTGSMAEDSRFNILGIDGDKQFKTTYANKGYRTAISISGGAKVNVPYQSSATSVGNSLTAQTTLDIVYGGRYVKITYEVKNSGSTTQHFKIGSSADVMIDNNDRAEVKGTSTGLSMDGYPKNNYKFQLVTPDCDTLWFGHFASAYTNIFNDLADKSNGYNGDSGMAWSWEDSVAPGHTWSRYVLIGAGEMPNPPDAPVLNDLPVFKCGEQVIITGTVGTGENAADTVHVSISGSEYQADVDENGNFTMYITVSADMPKGENIFTYWGTTDEGGISDIKSEYITIIDGPEIVLTTDSVTVMEDESGLDKTWLERFILSSYGTVSIEPEVIDTTAPGKQTVTYTASWDGFSDKTDTLTVTVMSKPAELSQTTVSRTGNFVLSSTMDYTGGLTYIETGFVYGALQNPTLTLMEDRVKTDVPVNKKGGVISVTLEEDALVYGITYYARAYAVASDGTVIYGEQSIGFGVGNPDYGEFSVAYKSSSGNKTTFTITRTGSDGEQTVYFRTVNGSAIGGTHFQHVADSETFGEGVTEKTITVTENSVSSTYKDNAATAYSNENRTYSLEIYRVTGGATIDKDNSSATRTMTVDDSLHVDADLFNVYQTSQPSGVVERGDFDGTGKGWTENEEGENAKDIVTISSILPPSSYATAVAQSIQYKLSFQAKEVDDGYQHIQISPGEGIDLGYYPYEGSWRGSMDTAIYAAIFEHGGNTVNTNYVSYIFPNYNGSVTNLRGDEIWREESTYKGVGYIKFPVNTEKLTVGFAGSGSKSDGWTTKDVTHHLKYLDTKEPQLLGVAPMSGGSYLPGDSVTVALVFDEIVDSANSDLGGVSVVTNWGTFSYSGGADTNVLYFTGKVSDDADGDLTVQTINNAGNIKDMADEGGSGTNGAVTNGGTEANLGSGASAPTVVVSEITNTNGTLTATVSCSPTTNVKLEYVWSDSSTAPISGWQLVTSGSTVVTRQIEGTWYIHARATNSDGVTAYGSRSIDLGGGAGDPVQLPSLTVATYDSDWAQSRQITVTRIPSDAKVTVKTPGSSNATEVSGGTYTATANGTYTFTLTSGDETIVKMITVSKIDRTAPTVDIVDLTNTDHTETVALTVRVSDGGSGVDSVTGVWSNGTTDENAVIYDGGNGVYTTTSPNESGSWTLTITAADTAGNTGADTSLTYDINVTRPGLTVTKLSASSTGVVYSYTVMTNGNTNIIVTLPDGSTTAELEGTFTITEPGDYIITVTDAVGHFVFKNITVDAPESGTLDGVAPDVRLSIADEKWTKGPVTVTVSVYDAGSSGSELTAFLDGRTITLTESADEPGSFNGSFEVSTNGTYTVTCTDAVSNVGNGSIDITNIDTTAPGIFVSGIPTDWTAGDVTVTLDVTDEESGVDSVEVKIDEKSVPVFGSNGTYTFTVSENGSYTVEATDKVGNRSGETVTISKIDDSTPSIEVTRGAQSAASLDLTINTGTVGISGVMVTVQKDGGTVEEVHGQTYKITSAGTYTFTATTGAGRTAVQSVTVHSVTIGENVELVVDGGKVTKPTDPTKDCYDFVGWYNGDAMWDFVTGTVTRDIVLTAEWTLSVPVVELTVSPDNASGTYNGGSTVVTLTAGVDAKADGVSYTYAWYRDGQKLDGIITETLELSTVGESGEYTVEVTASDGVESMTAGSNAVTVTISKADPVVSTWSTASDITYGEELGKSDLTGGLSDIVGTFAWKDGSIILNSGFHSSAVVFTPDDTDNYNTVERVIAVTVHKKTLIPSVSSVTGKEYDGNKSTTGTITLDGAVMGDTPSATSVFAFESPDAGQDKAVTVVVALDGNWGDNYQLSTNTLETTADITAKTVGLEWHGYENLTYTGHPVSVTATATGLVSGDACTVVVEDGDKVDAGTHTAKATGLSNANYRLPSTGATMDYTIDTAAGSASVTMASWVYGETAGIPVPVSDTNGINNVTYHYNGREGTTYNSDAVPTDAGSYTVTASFAATKNHEAVTATADFTIAKKSISGTWLGLDSVYGEAVQVYMTLSGVVYGDDVEISITGIKEIAGDHDLTAALYGTDATNYILKNGTATLTVQPKQVIFTVADNTVQADGSAKQATIMGDVAGFSSYTVTYRQGDKVVSSPEEAGSYEIWVKITDPNYRHTNGSDTMQVGSLTITDIPPVLYTASFAGGEGAVGTEPAQQIAAAEGQITLPANPFTRTDYRFRGWKVDGETKLYQPGDSFIMPARDVTFTAQWQAVFVVSGTITEEGSGDQTVENAVVVLWLGANKIDETTTEADGTYKFENLIPGIYNLVVTKDVRTVTSKVELKNQDTACNATLPKGATNSIVEVVPGSPNIVVGQLDTVFEKTDDTVYTEDDKNTVDVGGMVEITFTAEKKQKEDQTITADMDKIATEKDDSVTVGLVMDYKLEKTVSQADGTSSKPTRISQSNVLLEILLPLPTELQGKSSYSVYRVHEGQAQELTMTPSADLGEYFTVSSDKTELTLYVKCFSTYAIGYLTSTEDTDGGDSVGESLTPSYPPNIELPEHGSVTISPKNPQKGEQVTISSTPDEGYIVDGVTVTDINGQPVEVTNHGDGTFTFVQPAGKVTIAVTFQKITNTSDCPRDENCPVSDFSDTDRNAWYHDGVHYCVENNLMVGTGETTFAPNAATTRGMIVTILWRMEGSPIVGGAMEYDDVKVGDWYCEAVRWADSAGVVTGYGNGKFGPNDPVTREQMATMLWRYAGSPNVDGSLTAFVDGEQTREWARSAVTWTVEQGLIVGVGDHRLDPRGQTTRAQTATILMRVAENIVQ